MPHWNLFVRFMGITLIGAKNTENNEMLPIYNFFISNAENL